MSCGRYLTSPLNIRVYDNSLEILIEVEEKVEFSFGFFLQVCYILSGPILRYMDIVEECFGLPEREKKKQRTNTEQPWLAGILFS